jgi:hypothetical protein
LTQVFPGVPPHALLRAVAPLCELVVSAGLSHRRPAFGIDSVRIGYGSRKVRESIGLRCAPSYAGPIDARVNSTEVNRLAARHSIDWFERNLIGVAPLRYAGALRRVYPGFVQLAAYEHESRSARKSPHRPFVPSHQWQIRKSGCDKQNYDEHLAVMDLPAEILSGERLRHFSAARAAVGQAHLARLAGITREPSRKPLFLRSTANGMISAQSGRH